MVMVGDIAKLKVSYQHAADLKTWQITHQQEQLGVPQMNFVGTTSWVNQFWVTRSPLTLGVWMGKSWWVWRQVKVLECGATVALELQGAPESQLVF